MPFLGPLQHGDLSIPNSTSRSAILQSLVTFPLILTQSRPGNGQNLGFHFSKVCLSLARVIWGLSSFNFFFFLQILVFDLDDFPEVKLNFLLLKEVIKNPNLIHCCEFDDCMSKTFGVLVLLTCENEIATQLAFM